MEQDGSKYIAAFLEPRQRKAVQITLMRIEIDKHNVMQEVYMKLPLEEHCAH